MEYKEYALENSKIVPLAPLNKGFISPEEFKLVHRDLALLTADVLIEYASGFLLLKRENYPGYGEYFPVGGRVKKGVPVIEFLKQKALEECGLSIEDLKFRGVSRMFFQTDPFGHGAGTDTTSLMYSAKGKGELKLDDLHSEYILVNKNNFDNLKNELPPYSRDFIQECL